MATTLATGTWTEAAQRVLRERYVAKDAQGQPLETADRVFIRVAREIAEAERTWGADDEAVAAWAARFAAVMLEGRFMPNSPTIANAGKQNHQQWCACYVLPVGDSIREIFETMRDAALIHQSGGGVGYSFSRLRPRGARVATTSGVSSGPITFLEAYDTATEAITQGGMRRGANMAILRIDHPDILEFIDCKRGGGITNFNISVAITDEFMTALEGNGRYALRAQPGWPLPGGGRAHGAEVVGELEAQAVWRAVCEAAWATGDPGLFFVDRANRAAANALPELQQIEATNPCGEIPLPPFGVCTLGHLNLAKYVSAGQLDHARLAADVHLAVRFLDDVVERNPYLLPQIRGQALLERRIGLGVMGWADLLIMLGLPYASEEAIDLAKTLGAFLREEAIAASRQLAVERGPFPGFARSIYRHEPPRRNANLTTCAPTGTTSLLADCNSGIEPLFAIAYEHRAKQPDGMRVLTIINRTACAALEARGLATPAVRAAIEQHGHVRTIEALPADVRALLATAHEIDVDWHVRHQAAWQTAFSESAVSKTINVPRTATVDDVAHAYRLAWETGCLGITVFRDGCKGSQVLNAGKAASPAANGRLADADVPLIEPAPAVVDGKTFRVQTPLGKLFVTVNVNAEGEPFEVFIRAAKSGSDIEAFVEGLGRLMSTFLRFNRLPDRFARVREIIAQLEGIGGREVSGFGPSRVMSIPDGIAKALALFLTPPAPKEQLVLPIGGASHEAQERSDRRAIGDICTRCGVASVVRESGCLRCLSCNDTRC